MTTPLKSEPFCEYSAEGFGVIGLRVSEANDWLAEHPGYAGRIWGDWLDGSPRAQFDATEMFFPEPDEALCNTAEILANLAVEHNENRVGNTAIHHHEAA